MPCPICDKVEIRTRIGLNGVEIKPDCKCGSIRKKQRAIGCPACECKMIDLELDDDVLLLYIAICRDCKREWIV